MDRRMGAFHRKARGIKTISLSLLGLVALAGAAAIGLSLMIGSGVRSVSAAALREHPGDRIAALMAYVDSPAASLSQRNRAAWALGQIGDARALPLLERYYDGRPCDHEKALCQYELKKAIRGCRGGTNLLAWVWRGRFLRS
jgi:hypothetical protein